jgi:hypothetical protein
MVGMRAFQERKLDGFRADSLREKLEAYTRLQCPITGPGLQRLDDLLTAIVERIEGTAEGGDACELYCTVGRCSAIWSARWPDFEFAVVEASRNKAIAFTNDANSARSWVHQLNTKGYFEER